MPFALQRFLHVRPRQTGRVTAGNPGECPILPVRGASGLACCTNCEDWLLVKRMYQAGKLRRCGMESAALTTADLHSLEAFHSHFAKSNGRIKSTFYTKSSQTTRSHTNGNEGVRALANQPPLTHHIHGAQLKLFGHVLRATPSELE